MAINGPVNNTFDVGSSDLETQVGSFKVTESGTI